MVSNRPSSGYILLIYVVVSFLLYWASHLQGFPFPVFLQRIMKGLFCSVLLTYGVTFLLRGLENSLLGPGVGELFSKERPFLQRLKTFIPDCISLLNRKKIVLQQGSAPTLGSYWLFYFSLCLIAYQFPSCRR